MTPHATNRGGRTHPGSDRRHDARSSNPLVSYELSGEIRWLDVPLERIVLAVQSTNKHAGSFLGRDVTVDLTSARIRGGRLDQLLPGTQLHVKVRLERALHGHLPALFPAHSATLSPR